MVERQFEKRIKIFRTDNAEKICNQELQSYFTKLEIIHETLCAYTPQQNGVAEQRIGIIQEKGRALLLQSQAPIFLWDEAMLTATCLINQTATKVLRGRSPIQFLSSKFLSARLNNELPPKIFGCECYVHLHPTQKKLPSRALRCVCWIFKYSKKI